MIFATYGSFEIDKSKLREELKKNVWVKVEQCETGLSKACGCYVFAIKHGRSIKPCYVGKAEKQTFCKECSQDHKLQHLTKVIEEHSKGKIVLYLLARRMTKRDGFSRPTTRGYRDIDFLESMLIGFAIRRNPGLRNIKKAGLHRGMIVPGILNSPQGAPTDSDIELRREVFRLK